MLFKDHPPKRFYDRGGQTLFTIAADSRSGLMSLRFVTLSFANLGDPRVISQVVSSRWHPTFCKS